MGEEEEEQVILNSAHMKDVLACISFIGLSFFPR